MKKRLTCFHQKNKIKEKADEKKNRRAIKLINEYRNCQGKEKSEQLMTNEQISSDAAPMASSRLRLIFIPGMGADKRIFEKQLEYFPDSAVLDWVPPRSGEKIGEFAKRMVENAIPDLACLPTDRFLICGYSLGGIIAPYAAQLLEAEGVILLATFRHPKQFPLRYKLILYPLYFAPCLTGFIFWISKVVISFFYHLGKKRYPSRLQSLFRQYLDSPVKDLTRKIQMTIRWSRQRSDPLAANSSSKISCRQIHGKKDLVIPFSAVDPEEVIDGGHLFPVFKANLANRLIEKCCQEIEKDNQTTDHERN